MKTWYITLEREREYVVCKKSDLKQSRSYFQSFCLHFFGAVLGQFCQRGVIQVSFHSWGIKQKTKNV